MRRNLTGGDQMAEFSKFKPTVKRITATFLLGVMLFSTGGAAVCEAAANDTVSEINFQSAQLGFVLGGISKAFNVNFSVSSAAAVKVVSLHFKTATSLDDLLDMLRSTAGVSIEEFKERSYIVRTMEEMQGDTQGMSEREKEIFETEKRISKGVTKTFILNYVKAADVASALNKVLGESAKNVCSVSVLGGSDSEETEESGIIENEMREYSTILVYAVNENIMNHIEGLITAIDTPKPLVEVEAVFVEVSSNDNRDFGFDWNIMPNPIQFVESSIGTTIVDSTEAVPIFNKTTLGQFRRTSAASGEITANFVESNSKGRVLSNPRIRVMSGHVAGFASETQVPIMNKDSDGEVTTEYKNVGITLDILPVVLENDQIYLTVKPTVAAITDTVTMGETQAPQISERSAETTLLMRDGETMVIGGLLSDRDIKTMNKVPILWKIPLLGELFKSEGIQKEHSSISVYLRLRLIKDYMGEPRKPKNIPNVKVEQLLNGLTDSQIAAADRNNGGFNVREEVQGVIPMAMQNESVRADITPISKSPAKAPAKVTAPVEVTAKQENTPVSTDAAQKEDWQTRYDRLIREMQEREAAEKGTTQAKQAEQKSPTPTETAKPIQGEPVKEQPAQDQKAPVQEAPTPVEPVEELEPAAPDITDYLY